MSLTRRWYRRENINLGLIIWLHLSTWTQAFAVVQDRNEPNTTDWESSSIAGGSDTCPWRMIQQPAVLSQQQCSKGPQENEISELGGSYEGDGASEGIVVNGSSFEELGKPVLSFEEWKELMVRRQADGLSVPQTNDSWEVHATRGPDLAGEDSVGDKIDGKGGEPIAVDGGGHDSVESYAEKSLTDKVLYDDGKTQYYRSKDAGKTCKERFSYSSFDAGATVLKTSVGAKNPKAILVENKDTYMLLECAADQKYVIVELSDDILVDTVVLANFEFFSSMMRHFRVSASDRYPAKLDKWRHLGTFEAQNSRDIQAFLVENPQIWAKYVRIEFLTHYGNEYYCPVSLLRVHGTRMLESWNEPEPEPDSNQGREMPIEGDGLVRGAGVAIDGDLDRIGRTDVDLPAIEQTLTCKAPQAKLLLETHQTCGRLEDGLQAATSTAHVPQEASQVPGPSNETGTYSLTVETTPSATGRTGSATPPYSTTVAASAQTMSSPSLESASAWAPDSVVGETSVQNSTTMAQRSQSNGSATWQSTQPTRPAAEGMVAAPPRSKNSTGAASGPASGSTSPTVQESFFKTVSKRLQLLESNVTWSLKYVEDQSRNLQDALLRVEKGRLSKVEGFLETLNSTLMTEVNQARRHYEQMRETMASTFEKQRDQAQREIVALSARLNVLAEEVVFQKRMAIAQSILLLSCLVVIIFSRPAPHHLPPRSWMSTAQPDASQPFQVTQSPPHGNEGSPVDQDPVVPSTWQEEDPPGPFRGFSPPPSPSPNLTDFEASNSCRERKQSPRLRPDIPPLASATTRKPLPALPEYTATDHHDY